MHRLVLAFLAVALGGLPAAFGQRALRPAGCATTGRPGDDWTRYPFPGLRLVLSLPPGLRPLPYEGLRRAGRRAAERSIPMTDADSVELLAAWEAPARSAGEIRQVLLFSIRPDSVPPGRPCAFAVAGQPGYVFRMALSPDGRAADESRVEAYWHGFVLAAVGRSMDAYEIVFGILSSIAMLP